MEHHVFGNRVMANKESRDHGTVLHTRYLISQPSFAFWFSSFSFIMAILCFFIFLATSTSKAMFPNPTQGMWTRGCQIPMNPWQVRSEEWRWYKGLIMWNGKQQVCCRGERTCYLNPGLPRSAPPITLRPQGRSHWTRAKDWPPGKVREQIYNQDQSIFQITPSSILNAQNKQV